MRFLTSVRLYNSVKVRAARLVLGLSPPTGRLRIIWPRALDSTSSNFEARSVLVQPRHAHFHNTTFLKAGSETELQQKRTGSCACEEHRARRWQVRGWELEREEAGADETPQPPRCSRCWRLCSPAASGVRKVPNRAISYSSSPTTRMLSWGGWWVDQPGEKWVILFIDPKEACELQLLDLVHNTLCTV